MIAHKCSSSEDGVSKVSIGWERNLVSQQRIDCADLVDTSSVFSPVRCAGKRYRYPFAAISLEYLPMLIEFQISTS